MYAAITLLKFLPGMAERGADLYGDVVMPAYAEHVSRGAWIFAHPENDSAIVVVLYDSRKAADAGGEKKAVEQLTEDHGDVLAEPPRREVYNVIMGAVSGSTSQEPGVTALSDDILSLLEQVSRSL